MAQIGGISYCSEPTRSIIWSQIDEEKEVFIVNQRYRVTYRIHGSVYICEDLLKLDEQKELVIKILPRISIGKLKYEDKVYKMLETVPGYADLHRHNIGFPKILDSWLDNTTENSYMIMNHAGDSLDSLHKKYKNPETKAKIGFSAIQLCELAIPMIRLLQVFHSSGLVHRDIEPANICLNSDGTLTLLNFRAAGEYLLQDGQHIKKQPVNHCNGSIRSYCSGKRNKRTLSRKDDIEMLGLMLIVLSEKKLPWHRSSWNKKSGGKERQKRILRKLLSQLTKNLPPMFAKIVRYARSMDFFKEPNYSELIYGFQYQKEILLEAAATEHHRSSPPLPIRCI